MSHLTEHFFEALLQDTERLKSFIASVAATRYGFNPDESLQIAEDFLAQWQQFTGKEPKAE